MKYAALTVVAAALLMGCYKPQPEAAPTAAPAAPAKPTAPRKVTVDISTPDRALQTFWDQVDAMEEFDKATAEPEDPKKTAKLMEPLFALFAPKLEERFRYEVLNPVKKPELKISRTIDEVKVETPTRAVAIVTIRNATPIPPNVRLDENQEKLRRDGKRIRYVFTKADDGWKVAEMYEWQSYANTWKSMFPDVREPPSGYDYVFTGRPF